VKVADRDMGRLKKAMGDLFLHIGLSALILCCLVCQGRASDESQGETGVENKTIEAVLGERTAELMSIPGVVGTAQGIFNGKPCIVVYVIRKTFELQKRIPANLDGYPVVIEETGEIKSLQKKPRR
jgi:hypothetical protein